MIKRTFYNLPPEKREKIISVTLEEFAKGKKKKITINSVIEKAGISRGSFYQYFDDKLDLVELVANDIISKIVNFVQDELMLNNGDIFLVPIKIYDLMTQNSSNLAQIHALDPDSNQNSSLISDYLQYRSRKDNPFADFYNYIDKRNFKNSSEDYVFCVVHLLFDLVKTSIFNVNKNINDAKSERVILMQKINIIKNGALK